MAASLTPRKSGQFWVGMGLYGYLAITLVFPLLVIGLWAFYDPKVGWFPPDIVPRSFSVSAWREVWASGQIIPSALLSLLISGIVTLLTAVLAFPTAWGLGEIFFTLGLSGTVLGVVLVQTVGTLPLMIRILTATIEGIPKELLLAARTLGASPRTAVLRIGLPLAWPGLLAGSLLNFIGSFEEFEKSFLVGAPKIQTLAVRLWSYLGGQILVLPTASVVTFLLLLPMLVLFIAAERLMREDTMAAGLGKL